MVTTQLFVTATCSSFKTQVPSIYVPLLLREFPTSLKPNRTTTGIISFPTVAKAKCSFLQPYQLLAIFTRKDVVLTPFLSLLLLVVNTHGTCAPNQKIWQITTPKTSPTVAYTAPSQSLPLQVLTGPTCLRRQPRSAVR